MSVSVEAQTENGVRRVWDFSDKSNIKSIDLDYAQCSFYDFVYEYNGLFFYLKSNTKTTLISSDGFVVGANDSESYIFFTPQYDGELTVTYNSTHSGISNRTCIVCKSTEPNGQNEVASGTCKMGNEDCELLVKLTKNESYCIYTSTGGVKFSKLIYTPVATSAVVNGENVQLTTTANMQGWRAFYDAENSYTVAGNTKVYIAVNGNDVNEVVLVNKTGNRVPKQCPVILSSDDVQNDGTYSIQLAMDAEPVSYDGNDNLLIASEKGKKVENAYRLGYKAGEDYGVAFYKWNSENPDAGIVYIQNPANNSNAKISFVVNDITTSLNSISHKKTVDGSIYSIYGQRRSAIARGIKIVNGKKVIVR